MASNNKFESEINKAKSNATVKTQFYDSLTGLPTASQFSKNFERILKISEENDLKFALLSLDIDNFKDVNAKHGLDTGDLVLKEVAERLKKILKEILNITRCRTDEYLILIPNIKNNIDVANITQKIFSSLSKTFDIDQKAININVSIGISVYPSNAATPETLIMFADSAMIAAKNQGGNSYQFYENTENDENTKYATIEKDLRRAIKRNELVLYYHPRMDTQTGEITGMEALIRWNHPKLGLIQPSKFIHIAEQSTLIQKVGGWVLNHGCKQTKLWYQQGLPLRLSINISVKQINKKFVRQVKQILESTMLDPKYLELEIPEEAFKKNNDEIINILYQLKNLRLLITVDNYGKDSVSINNLSKLPIDTVKIYQGIVQGSDEDESKKEAIKNIINEVHELDLKCTAEGVENENELKTLKKLKCDSIQGYYISRPLPTDEFITLIH